MNRERMEALLDAAKLCRSIADELVQKPGDEVIGAMQCVNRINKLIAQEAGFAGQEH